MKKILITGCAGYTGRHLIDRLVTINKNCRLYGLDVIPKSPSKKVTYYRCDMLNKTQLESVIKKIRPDTIFNLTGSMTADKQQSFAINVTATKNLFDVILRLRLSPVILIIGSAAEYGLVKKSELPIKETLLAKPVTVYAISKTTQTLLSRQYAKTRNLKIVIARTFNLVGPGQPPALFCGSIINQLSLIKQSKQKPEIFVGNIKPRRDFVDVRDAVDAYIKLTSVKKYGEIFNVGSGKSYPISYVLNKLVKFSGVPAKITVDKTRVKKNDVPDIFADITKIRRMTGWKPKIKIDKSLKDMVGII
jgi:GDP-4-dehydro-6-deoxy-D-mannose reductase